MAYLYAPAFPSVLDCLLLPFLLLLLLHLRITLHTARHPSDQFSKTLLLSPLPHSINGRDRLSRSGPSTRRAILFQAFGSYLTLLYLLLGLCSYLAAAIPRRLCLSPLASRYRSLALISTHYIYNHGTYVDLHKGPEFQGPELKGRHPMAMPYQRPTLARALLLETIPPRQTSQLMSYLPCSLPTQSTFPMPTRYVQLPRSRKKQRIKMAKTMCFLK